MHSIVHAYGVSAVIIFIYMTLAYGVSRLIGKRNDFADVAWGGGFIVVALGTFLLHSNRLGTNLASNSATVLVCVWGLRLLVHIFRRFRRSSGVDRRYQAMQTKWGKHVEITSYLVVFLSQGLLALLISAPVVIMNSTSTRFVPGMTVGIALWIVGFYFEAVGDAQLTRFLTDSNNKGKLMTRGLWRYSRHPNYFGEITQWWGLFVMALFVPYGWLGVIGPLTITVLITRVSGVPLLERHYASRPDWEIYKAHTSKLFPLPPRK